MRGPQIVLGGEPEELRAGGTWDEQAPSNRGRHPATAPAVRKSAPASGVPSTTFQHSGHRARPGEVSTKVGNLLGQVQCHEGDKELQAAVLRVKSHPRGHGVKAGRGERVTKASEMHVGGTSPRAVCRGKI